jgi:hypothetical protein
MWSLPCGMLKNDMITSTVLIESRCMPEMIFAARPGDWSLSMFNQVAPILRPKYLRLDRARWGAQRTGWKSDYGATDEPGPVMHPLQEVLLNIMLIIGTRRTRWFDSQAWVLSRLTEHVESHPSCRKTAPVRQERETAFSCRRAVRT